MNIKIEANFNFSVESIRYAPSGELCITLFSGDNGTGSKFLYTASLGSGRAEEHPSVDLASYTRAFVASRNIKEKSKDPYYQMLRFLGLQVSVLGSSFIPQCGAFISTGLAVVDVIWGDDIEEIGNK